MDKVLGSIPCIRQKQKQKQNSQRSQRVNLSQLLQMEKFSELVSGRADAARDGPVSANAISECTF